MKRRQFLKSAAWVSTGLIFVPRCASGQTAIEGPPKLPLNPAGGGAGPNAWFDSTLTANGNADTAGPNFMEFVPVTVSSGGTANQLRWKYFSSSSPNNEPIKLAFYDNSRNLLAQGSGTVPLGLSTDTYVVVTIPDTVIASGSYFVAQATNPGTGVLKASTNSGGNGPYKSLAFASFPPSTLPTEDGHLAQWLAGVFVL